MSILERLADCQDAHVSYQDPESFKHRKIMSFTSKSLFSDPVDQMPCQMPCKPVMQWRFPKPALPKPKPKPTIEKPIQPSKPHPEYVQMMLLNRCPDWRLKKHIEYLSACDPLSAFHWFVDTLRQCRLKSELRCKLTELRCIDCIYHSSNKLLISQESGLARKLAKRLKRRLSIKQTFCKDSN